MSELANELADNAAVLATVVAYAHALDSRDWDRLEALFVDDSAWEYRATEERVVGRAAIAARLKSSVAHLDAPQHFNGTHAITLDGDEAWHVGYFQAQHVRRDAQGGELFLGAGRYEDHVLRTETGWKFRERVVFTVWTQGNVAVLKPPSPNV